MKRLGFAAVFLVMAGMLFVSFGYAQDYVFGYSVDKTWGKMKLKLTATSIEGDRVLGVTLYPLNVKDAAKETVNYFFLLKKGAETVEIDVDPKFKNGTFEASLWTKKVPKSECLQTDALCQKFGFRAGGYSVSYMWGYLYTP